MRAPRGFVSFVIAGTLLAAAGCGGGDDGGGGGGLTASFTPSATAAGPNVVRLVEASRAGDLVTLEVQIGGPTTSSDLFAFAFDLVLGSPSVASYVSGSIQEGSALQVTSGVTDIVADAAQDGDRVVVGITKLGSAATGNGVAGSSAAVVRLTFRVRAVGATTITFDGSSSPQFPQTGEPLALDSNLDPVPSVAFDSASATLRGA